MKILLAVFLCATWVVVSPTTEVPQRGSLQKKILQTSPSDNDILLKANNQPTEVEASTSLTKEQEAKGEEILENIFTKIVGKINDVIKADNMNDSNILKNSTVTAEVRDLILDPKSDITKRVQTEFEPIRPIDHDDPFEYPTYDYIPEYPLNPSMNAKDSAFTTAPADIIPKGTDEKKPKEKQTFVEIPLEMQKSNPDGTLPDLDDEIKDTILNDPSFKNPILSPYDTLPLESNLEPIEPMAEENISNPEMDVFPEPDQQEDFSLQTDTPYRPFALDTVPEMEPLDFDIENEQNNLVEDEPTLQRQNLDYDTYDETPTVNDYNNYDYDNQERQLPVPNQFSPMNPFIMNRNPFGKPFQMNNNPHFIHPSMMNPFAVNQKDNIYRGMPFSPYQNSPNDLLKGQSMGPKIDYSHISQLMEQILPELFKNTSPNNPGEKIDSIILIEGNPSSMIPSSFKKRDIIKKHSPNVDHPESKIPKQNGHLVIEIGNVQPMNDIYEQSASPTSRFPSMMKALFKNNLPTDDQKENIEPFGIKAVGEASQNAPESETMMVMMNEDNNEQNEDQINEIDSQNWDFNPMNIYAPGFLHAYFMHPELYKAIYPNRQYMSQLPYFDHYSENMHPTMNYENQQSIMASMNYGNREPLIPPMNYENQVPDVPPMNYGNRQPIVSPTNYGNQVPDVPSMNYGNQESNVSPMNYGNQVPDVPSMNYGNREPNVSPTNYGNQVPDVPSMNYGNRQPIVSPTNYGNQVPDVPSMNYGNQESIVSPMNYGNREQIVPPMNFGNREPIVPSMNYGNREPLMSPMNYLNRGPISPMNYDSDLIDTGHMDNMDNMKNNYQRFPNQYNMNYNRHFMSNNYPNPMMNNYNRFPDSINDFNRFYQPNPYGPYPNPNY